MLLSEYIKQHPEKNYRYTGTIWGSTPCIMTGEQIVWFLEQIADNTEIGENPSISNIVYLPEDAGIYYLRSDGIHYVGYLTNELVFEELII